MTWWIDTLLVRRVSNGTDHAVRLAAVLTYVGVDGSYTFARALGFTAMVFAYGTVVLGLLLPRSAGQSRSDLGALHRQLGAVTLALIAAHAAVPYTSVVPPYGGWRTNFLPWLQPVSWGIRAASWESLGIVAFYLLVLTGPTYYLVRRRRSVWSALHRLTVVAYGLAVTHAFLLGTDFVVAGPLRIALLAAQVPLLALLCHRLLTPPTAEGSTWSVTPHRHRLRRIAATCCGVGAAVVAALTILSATGEYAQGMRL